MRRTLEESNKTQHVSATLLGCLCNTRDLDCCCLRATSEAPRQAKHEIFNVSIVHSIVHRPWKPSPTLEARFCPACLTAKVRTLVGVAAGLIHVCEADGTTKAVVAHAIKAIIIPCTRRNILVCVCRVSSLFVGVVYSVYSFFACVEGGDVTIEGG